MQLKSCTASPSLFSPIIGKQLVYMFLKNYTIALKDGAGAGVIMHSDDRKSSLRALGSQQRSQTLKISKPHKIVVDFLSLAGLDFFLVAKVIFTV
ncbi:hypothetical protein FKM82_015146 [Ascaphus truei]